MQGKVFIGGGGVEYGEKQGLTLKYANRHGLVAGATGRALYDPADPFARNRAPDDQIWALDHWQIKLLRLPDAMLTAKGREIATARAGIMRVYLSQLTNEITP